MNASGNNSIAATNTYRTELVSTNSLKSETAIMEFVLAPMLAVQFRYTWPFF